MAFQENHSGIYLWIILVPNFIWRWIIVIRLLLYVNSMSFYSCPCKFLDLISRRKSCAPIFDGYFDNLSAISVIRVDIEMTERQLCEDRIWAAAHIGFSRKVLILVTAIILRFEKFIYFSKKEWVHFSPKDAFITTDRHHSLKLETRNSKNVCKSNI